MEEIGPPGAEPDEHPSGHDEVKGGRTARSRWRLGGIGLVAALAVVGSLVAASVLAGRPSGTTASAQPIPTPTTIAAGSAAVVGSQKLTPAAIAAKVDPGLVDISVTFAGGSDRGAATGMVLTPSGVVLTNNHVIDGVTKISVTDLGNGKTYPATVVGYARTRDVAVLQMQGASGLQTVPLGTSSTVRVGAKVATIGNAGGVGGIPRLATGRVIALGQSITASDVGGANAEHLSGLIETNSSIRPGDSGGPMVDTTGRVIGIDAAASASLAVQPSAAQGYAIPIDEAVAIADQIETGSTSPTVHVGPAAFLGVEVTPFARAAQPGAVVGGVLPGYPAARAGLTGGDVITAVGGKPVTSATALTGLLSSLHPGDAVQVQWSGPGGGMHTTTITLASGPAA